MKIKKITALKCHLLFYATTMNYFSIELSHVMKSGFYTTGNSRLSGWTEKELQSTSQSQTCFLNFSETITSEKSISEMHQKLQHLQPALVNRKGPICLHNTTQLYVAQPLLQKLKETGNEILPHLPYSLDLLPTNYHFFKHLNNFLQGKHFCNKNAEKCFPRVCRIPRHRFLCYRNKQTYFLLAKMC